MTAEEVLDGWIDCSSSDTGAGILNALKVAGYAVVELPDLDVLEEYVSVSSRFPDAPICTGVDGSMGATYQSVADARRLAAALLAAAASVDAEPDPHAGQLWANELQSRQRQVPSDREWS